MEYSPYTTYGTDGTSPYNYPSTTFPSPQHGQPGSPNAQILPQLQPSTSPELFYNSNPGTPRAGTPRAGTPNTHNPSVSYPPSTYTGVNDGRYPTFHKPRPADPDYDTSQLMTPGATTACLPNRFTRNNRLPGEGDQFYVVGSQGRRGILPSAPGYPVAPAAGTPAAKNTVKPVEDADGRFPCPHCTKTYLHFKHLKRHILRHTGDRRYMCVLCRDRFYRSDILKRHFKKCSSRRGNPIGASHRSHSAAGVRRSPETPATGTSWRDMSPPVNGLAGDNTAHYFGRILSQDGTAPVQHVTNEQLR